MIKEYLGMHKAGALVFVAFSVVYAVIFGLYGLPVAAVGYASAICLFMGAILLVLDYGRVCEKHKKRALDNKIEISMCISLVFNDLSVSWINHRSRIQSFAKDSDGSASLP